MGFNRRKMEDQRREAAEKEAANRRATDAQVLEDAGRLIAAWNERQAERMPMIFSPTIGAAIAAGFWFLWVRCPACRTINAIDLRRGPASQMKCGSNTRGECLVSRATTDVTSALTQKSNSRL
jgi:phage FluMu protein Com